MTNSEQNSHGSELSHFERNRYFYGKLVTAHDMQVEQDYHVDRLNTLSRLVVGEGVVCGLNVATVEEADDEIEITVEPGVALDCHGRPIVVEDTVTQSLNAPSGNEIYVFLSHRESSKDHVPVMGSERTYEENCTYNRILETYEVTYRENPPDIYKTVPEIEFPSGDELGGTDGTELVELARSYHQQQLETCKTCDNRPVFLGSFEKSNGAWEGAETERRPHVYNNDMLYAAIVGHIADQNNPHNISIEGIPKGTADEKEKDIRPIEEIPEEIEDRLDELEERIETIPSYEDRLERLEERNASLEEYVRYKSLDYKIRSFGDVADEFDSDAARHVAEMAKGAIVDETFEDEDEYVDFIEDVFEWEREVVVEVEDKAIEKSLEEYSNAVEALETVRKTGEDVLQVAMAQDRVCQAAAWLQEGHDIERI